MSAELILKMRQTIDGFVCTTTGDTAFLFPHIDEEAFLWETEHLWRAVGGILFLVFGVMAGFYSGSYGTLFILQKLMGGTVEPTLFVRAAIVVGIGVGIAASATVHIITGGLIGTALGFIVSAPKVMKEAKASAKA